jgi:stearoyl-CoA desaturase (Delta-9 desaturase)
VLAWVSDHRKHHQFSDQEGDPHSPHVGFGDGILDELRGLWHAHSGWLLSAAGRAEQSRYAKDLLRDRGMRVIAKLFLPLLLFSLAAPAVAGWLLLGGR